ncbi:MAG: AMP-dependent synthetase [Rhodospirillales bacterium 69-11]|nr:AMP-binding protein [Rhodospirillales bacterium]MBN8926083.1 AMP-binding protein [Rhodospirillales bacterium]OJW30551.1 MAG: AMP-dependent synthetase [Rhodospirillales bacterium 69-11]
MSATPRADAGFAWYPPDALVTSSNAKAFLDELGIPDYDTLIRRADADPAWFWGEVARRLAFYRPWDETLDVSRGVPFARWCVGGKTNLVLNALDRHRGGPLWAREVIVAENEAGAVTRWTYAMLDDRVCRLAAGLHALGLRAGDVVGLFLPTIPEAVAAYLACAKIGAIALPMFSGFGASAVADRLVDSQAVALITADGTSRRGSLVPMKSVADEAAAAAPSLRHMIVVRNVGVDVAWREGRDHWLDTLIADQDPGFATLPLDADAPLMLMYTSGTTGRPKGTVHTHVGFPAKMLLDVGIVMDLKSTDRLLWMSDMGWLVGPMVAVAVTMQGASVLLAEGSPDYPDAGRMWRLIQDFHVSFLGIAPTTARGFIRNGGGGIERYDLSSLRICASTGEVWTPEAWEWTFDKVCGRRVPILNYSGGTEVGGGILSGTVLHPIKPCGFARPVPGMGAAVVDSAGHPVPPGTVGELVLTKPSIGLTRGLWHDDARYLESYWEALPGLWRHGDWAVVDADGHWAILGRSDDTLKVAGKRTGPSEIEALLAATGLVAESAVIGLPDPVKGEAVCCVVIPMPGITLDAAVRERLVAAVVAGLGIPFRPRVVIAVDDLPRTRNMKVMRRVVRTAFLGAPPGDLSSLVNPESVAELHGKIAAAGLSPPSGDAMPPASPTNPPSRKS